MNSANLLCIRFDFGVPLEDIFPPDDIHPRLYVYLFQNLFNQIYWTFTSSNMPLSDVLNNNLRTSSQEKLTLIHRFVKGKLHYEEVLKPELYFWLLKHFLELLPLPLFPKQTSCQVYDWLNLAFQCKMCRIKRNSLLDSNISCYIQKLPKCNNLLIDNLMDFLRKVCFKPNSLGSLNMKSVIATVKYFCSSLFLYSYEPEIKLTMEKLHYPLLTYLIIYWPKIKHDFEKNPNKNFKEISKNMIIDNTNFFSKNKFMDRGCQTSFGLLDYIAANRNISHKSVTTEKQDKYKVLLKSLNPEINKSFDSKNGNRIEQNESYNGQLTHSTGDKNKLTPPEPEDGSYESVYDFVKRDEFSEMMNSTFLNCDSESAIYQTERFDKKQFLAKKMLKLNKSFSSVISKFSEKIKMKPETSKSDTKLGTFKYDLLKNPNCEKVPISKLNYFINKSPNIKYKKLLTL